jgi:hypothetical protein
MEFRRLDFQQNPPLAQDIAATKSPQPYSQPAPPDLQPVFLAVELKTTENN